MNRPRLGALFALLLFTALAAYQLNLPGLHNDEAQEAGLPAAQIVAGRPITAFRGATIRIAGLDWPLMVQDYIGPINVVLAVPFLAALGPSVFALRLMAVTIGLVTLSLTYAFASAAFSPRTGAIAALLLAAQPSFVFWSRQGIFVTSITSVFALVALWALARWARERKAWQAGLVGLSLGLGVYAKLLFLWIIGGLVGTGFLLGITHLALPRKSKSHREGAKSAKESPPLSSRTWRLRGSDGLFSMGPLTPAWLCLLAFALGVVPLLLYNLKTGGTLASVGDNLTTSYYGVDNLDIGRNLLTRWDQLRAVLAGREHLWYLGGSFGNPATEWALGLACAVVVVRALARRPGSLRPLALVVFTLIAFLQTTFTVSGLFPTHFAILMPFLPMIVAAGLEGLAKEFNAKTPGREGAERPVRFLRALGVFAVYISIVGLIIRDIWDDVNYHRALSQTGGLNAHSDAIYALSGYLEREAAGRPVVALDWGIAPQVRFLTGERVVPQEIFGYTWEPDETFQGLLSTALDEPNTLFVLHWPQETIFPRREAFEAALAERGLRAVTLATFSRRDGAPIFDVVRLD